MASLRYFLPFLSSIHRNNYCPKLSKIIQSKRHFAEVCSTKSSPDLANKLASESNLPYLTLMEKLGFLNSIGIDNDTIQRNKHLIHIPIGKIRSNLEVLQSLNVTSDAVPELLIANQQFFTKCMFRCKNDLSRCSEHRIQYLSSVLKVSQKEICKLFTRYNFLLSLSYSQLRSVINVLLEHNVLPEDILRDPWILRCKSDAVATRLRRVESADVCNIKPWMGRCSERIFENFLRRVSTKQKIVGELSLEEYLSERLGRPSDEIKMIIDRQPELQKTSILKMKRVLDFLFASGFPSSHILSALPRVANRRIETIHSRLLEFNQLGIPPNLYILCKSKKEYCNYVKKWKNRNK